MSDKKIRVAIVGVGNCASALVQGLERYKHVDESSTCVPGLMHPSLGGYLVRDIEIVAAFDVNARKIGKDIAEAIWVSPNNAKKFCDVPPTGVMVSPGYLGDGLSKRMRKRISVTDLPPKIDKVLQESGAEMLVSFLPVGSKKAARHYANKCIKNKVAFVNAMPEFIASAPEWAEKFREAGVAIAGDDVMSQVGATIIHEIIAALVLSRGQTVLETTQLNVGGNADFENMLDHERVVSKKKSKSARLEWVMGRTGISALPAAYLAELQDRKTAYITFKGEQFGGVFFEMELKLQVEDSPNSAGVIVDAIRLMKLSLNRGEIGYQQWSEWLFKRPMELHTLEDQRKLMEDFIEKSLALSKLKLVERSAS